MNEQNYLITHMDQYDLLFSELEKGFEGKKIIYLTGDLGSGKTSFVKKFFEYKYEFEGVSSPTFGIINSYNIDENTIYHYDLYRIQKISELDDIGFYSYLEINTLHFIEWPEIIPKKIIKPNANINFIEDNNQRIISITYVDE